MITQFRLNSVTAYGISGPEAGAIDIIYSYLFKEFGMSMYSYISINQIGDKLNEFISVEGKRCHVNIRFTTNSDFEKKDDFEKNKVRLAVMHEALLRLANYDKKLDKEKLELIRKKILKCKFNFQFVCKGSVCKKDTTLTANIIVSPYVDRFDYFIQILKKGHVKCMSKIYSGRPTLFYFGELFSIIKWKGKEEIEVSGKRQEAIIKLNINSCEKNFINLTSYPFPPYFQMMRTDISAEDSDLAAKSWLDSLPEDVREVIKNNKL